MGAIWEERCPREKITAEVWGVTHPHDPCLLPFSCETRDRCRGHQRTQPIRVSHASLSRGKPSRVEALESGLARGESLICAASYATLMRVAGI